MPAQRAHYVDALMLGQLIVFDLGLSIRDKGGGTVLPTILINMADVFERCLRRVLAEGLRDDSRIEVKDGNIGGAGGAKCLLFDPLHLAVTNPVVTPDIVVCVKGVPTLVIDAKYKPAPNLPDRNDVNQAVLYGARYGTSRVMLLHAGRPHGRQSVEHCGNVGGFEVYNGMVNLNATPIEDEEATFVAGVRALL